MLVGVFAFLALAFFAILAIRENAPVTSNQHQHSSPIQQTITTNDEISEQHLTVPILEKQQEPVESTAKQYNSATDNNDSAAAGDIHVIFSTGCSTFQDWQSYVFFYHAYKSGQKGTVTRIASGCKEKDAEILKRLHKEQIEIMSTNFRLHLTPEYSRVKPRINFKYFNKPFGLKHWMENALGYPDKPENDDAMVILLDPDQIILRPFTKDFTSSTEVWKPTNSRVPLRLKVEHGSPFGQLYGFGIQWKTKVNITYVTGGEPSRVSTMSDQEARDHYSLGPPYIGKRSPSHCNVSE